MARLAQPQPDASINGITLFLPANVYHPGTGLSSRFLVDALLDQDLGDSVLDLGCDSGFVGVSVYRPGMRVVLADIADTALASAEENRRRIGVQAEIVLSDLFDGLQGRCFDSILFNPPLFDKDIEHEAEVALCDPDGKLLKRFLSEAPAYLNSNGKIYFTVSNLMNRSVLLEGLHAYRYDVLSSSFSDQSEVARWVLCASPRVRANAKSLR